MKPNNAARERVISLLSEQTEWVPIQLFIQPTIWETILDSAQETNTTAGTVVNIWLAAYLTSIDNDET